MKFSAIENFKHSGVKSSKIESQWRIERALIHTSDVTLVKFGEGGGGANKIISDILYI